MGAGFGVGTGGASGRGEREWARWARESVSGVRRHEGPVEIKIEGAAPAGAGWGLMVAGIGFGTSRCKRKGSKGRKASVPVVRSHEGAVE